MVITGRRYAWLSRSPQQTVSLRGGEAHTGVIANMPSLADSLTLQKPGQGQAVSGWPLASLCLAGFLAAGGAYSEEVNFPVSIACHSVKTLLSVSTCLLVPIGPPNHLGHLLESLNNYPSPHRQKRSGQRNFTRLRGLWSKST